MEQNISEVLQEENVDTTLEEMNEKDLLFVAGGHVAVTSAAGTQHGSVSGSSGSSWSKKTQ